MIALILLRYSEARQSYMPIYCKEDSLLPFSVDNKIPTAVYLSFYRDERTAIIKYANLKSIHLGSKKLLMQAGPD